MSKQQFCSINDAAEMLGVCERTVRNLIARGQLPAYRLGGRKTIRIRLADVEAALVRVPTMGGAA